MEFYNTVMGKAFYTGTMPRIADALQTIAMKPKTETFAVEVSEEDAAVEICKRGMWGERYLDGIPVSGNKIVLIFEKEAKR